MLEFEDNQDFTESTQETTTVTIDDPIKSRKQRNAAGPDLEGEEVDPLDNSDKTKVSGKQL